MGHFAKVVDGVVIDVIVAKQDYIDTLEDKDLYVKTSYNTRRNKHWAPDKTLEEEDTSKPALRGNYATKGGIYDSVNDVFYKQKDYPSSVLNTEVWEWEHPITKPSLTEQEMVEGYVYRWDEDVYYADTGNPKTKGWVKCIYTDLPKFQIDHIILETGSNILMEDGDRTQNEASK